ncbi:MAG: hypothetical protein KDM63_15370, partial [Verrucomicrobiae bacterium]|nr:hypothetical protein [Verrucomicrobiae bacterium]
EEFKERQRSEILRISSRGLLIERVHTWIWSTGTRRWLAAGSATSALVVAGFFLIPDSTPDTPSASNSASMEKIEEPKPATPSQAETPASPAKR